MRDCTDGTAGDKAAATTPEAKRADWLGRKLAYLAHLGDEPEASLLVGACDTFRAGAVRQLEIWADRIGIDLVKGASGSDPASW